MTLGARGAPFPSAASRATRRVGPLSTPRYHPGDIAVAVRWGGPGTQNRHPGSTSISISDSTLVQVRICMHMPMATCSRHRTAPAHCRDGPGPGPAAAAALSVLPWRRRDAKLNQAGPGPWPSHGPLDPISIPNASTGLAGVGAVNYRLTLRWSGALPPVLDYPNCRGRHRDGASRGFRPRFVLAGRFRAGGPHRDGSN